jgi:hypothetical protein
MGRVVSKAGNSILYIRSGALPSIRPFDLQPCHWRELFLKTIPYYCQSTIATIHEAYCSDLT